MNTLEVIEQPPPTLLTDETGTYNLADVHSVTPHVHLNPSAAQFKKRTVAVLHFRSGHSLTTDTDIEIVRAKVFGPF